MYLRDVFHAAAASKMFDAIKQELLMCGSETLADMVDEIEQLDAKLIMAVEKETGTKWSDD